MTTPFASIESALASGVVASLANAAATIGGATVEGIFDNAYADALGFVSGSQPTMLFLSSAIASAAVGDEVIVGGISYVIAAIQPDGTGMTRLMLEKA